MRAKESALVSLVKREPVLQSGEGTVTINYRWELKGDKERAYLEMSAGGVPLRTHNLSQICLKEKEAREVVLEEVKALRRFIRKKGNICGPFDCYYLRGEPQKEAYWGKF